MNNKTKLWRVFLGEKKNPLRVIPFLVGVLQVGSGEAEFKLGHVLGVVDAGGEHLSQVGSEGGQTLGQVGVKTLADEDTIND